MRASHLEDYYSFLRFPSVSTDDEYAEKVTECAHWLVEKLNGIGLETKLCRHRAIRWSGRRTNINPGAAPS